jgi:hypothetical protein
MTHSEEYLSVTIPLTTKAHFIAEEFWEYHENHQKASEVFLNTLAVYAVHSYLEKLGIQTDLSASDSWKPSKQSCMNIADLWVTNKGRLECRPVWLEAQGCPIPTEVRNNRIGYVVVQISECLQQATILGYTQAPLTNEIRITELQSLEFLIELLIVAPVNLSQWLQNIFDTCWVEVDTLLKLEQDILGFSVRTSQRVIINEVDNLAGGVRRAKLIELKKHQQSQQVVLAVGITPAAEPEMNLWVEIYPTNAQTYLPKALELIISDEKGIALMTAMARNTKNIQIKFSGKRGERFTVKVALDNHSITEAFLI